MEPATRRINQSTEGHEISKTIRSQSTRSVEAVGTSRKADTSTTSLMSQKKPYPNNQPQDGQIISNSSYSNKPLNKSQVWDCGSSLYDSFELKSLNLQLDLAIKGSSRRTLSMPHLPVYHIAHAPYLSPPPKPALPATSSVVAKHQAVPKNFGKVSKSFRKILRSMFSSSKCTVTNIDTTQTGPTIKVKTLIERQKGSLYVYDGSKSMRSLSTIPEVQEINDGHTLLSPDATPAVRRVASERFTASSVRVS